MSKIKAIITNNESSSLIKDDVEVTLPINKEDAVEAVYYNTDYQPEDIDMLYNHIKVMKTSLPITNTNMIQSFTLNEYNNLAHLIQSQQPYHRLHEILRQDLDDIDLDNQYIDTESVIDFASAFQLNHLTKHIISIDEVRGRLDHIIDTSYTDTVSEILKYLHALDYDTSYEYFINQDDKYIEPVTKEAIRETLNDLIIELI